MKLDQPAITTAQKDVPEWTLDGDTIRRSFKFADFADAMVFVNAVAEMAEAANHHPDIDIRYNQVSLALSTHDAGGLTKKDFNLAKQVDELGAV